MEFLGQALATVFLSAFFWAVLIAMANLLRKTLDEIKDFFD